MDINGNIVDEGKHWDGVVNCPQISRSEICGPESVEILTELVGKMVVALSKDKSVEGRLRALDESVVVVVAEIAARTGGGVRAKLIGVCLIVNELHVGLKGSLPEL